MTVKRRAIWVSDEDWSKIGEIASKYGLTVSAYLRVAADTMGRAVWQEGLVILEGNAGSPRPETTTSAPTPGFGHSSPAPKPKQ